MRALFNKLARTFQRFLPGSWRRALRRRYYLGVVSRFSESDWEWAPVIKPLVPSGGRVIDIGANVGYLSGLFARWVGAHGAVISVEPIPATYDALSSSMSRLFPGRVRTFQCCVSDQPGTVTMSVPVYEDGGANYYESRIVGDGDAAGADLHTVEATTMDQLAGEDGAAVSFVKIDVEGHELSVIQGGGTFLAEHHPPLLIEVSGSPDEEGSAASRLFSHLGGLGYSPYIQRDGNPVPRSAGDISVDYLFLHASNPTVS